MIHVLCVELLNVKERGPGRHLEEDGFDQRQHHLGVDGLKQRRRRNLIVDGLDKWEICYSVQYGVLLLMTLVLLVQEADSLTIMKHHPT